MTDELQSTERGYYLNGIRAKRAEIQHELRLSESRAKRMEGVTHPDAQDQRAWCGILREFITRLDAEEKAVQS